MKVLDIIKKTELIILAGGKGSRILEKTKRMPKPMIKIGNKPILWHIIKIFETAKLKSFIIATGFKYRNIDSYIKKEKQFQNITIKPCFTGKNSMTGGRLLKLKDKIKSDFFLMTYGDGLADININKLINFHLKHKKLATISVVRPPARWGHVKIKKNKVNKFEEKNQLNEGWINGGFFVLNKKIFKYITKGSKTIFESDVLPLLAKKGELMAYKHDGFWQCMDTLRDHNLLNELWKKNPLWKIW